MKSQEEIDQHSKWAKALMQKGADDFATKLAEAEKKRVDAKKEAETPQEDFEKIDNSSGKI